MAGSSRIECVVQSTASTCARACAVLCCATTCTQSMVVRNRMSGWMRRADGGEKGCDDGMWRCGVMMDGVLMRAHPAQRLSWWWWSPSVPHKSRTEAHDAAEAEGMLMHTHGWDGGDE